MTIIKMAKTKMKKINKKGVVVGNPMLIGVLILLIMIVLANKFSAANQFPTIKADTLAVHDAFHRYHQLNNLQEDAAHYSFDFALYDFAKSGAHELQQSTTYFSSDKEFLGLSDSKKKKGSA